MIYEIGKNRIYNNQFVGRDDVVSWDVQKITQNQLIRITFISTNSCNQQGIRLAIDAGEGNIEINNQLYKSMELWQDTAPKELILKCNSSEGLLSVYNIWSKFGRKQSQLRSAGMLLKQENNTTLYFCNDVGFETNFDKLIFSLEKL